MGKSGRKLSLANLATFIPLLLVSLALAAGFAWAVFSELTAAPSDRSSEFGEFHTVMVVLFTALSASCLVLAALVFRGLIGTFRDRRSDAPAPGSSAHQVEAAPSATQEPSTVTWQARERRGRWERGEVIDGRYRVQDIRVGGMGTVYLCYDIANREPVAVKAMVGGVPWSSAAVERFRREALLWIQLEKHPHIVQAHHVRQIGEQLAIFMEMVPADERGRVSLADWIGSASLSLPEILKLAVHICWGMSYAHKKLGLVHRDLKPSNVLIAPGMVAKVTDFGLAKGLGDANVAYRPAPTRRSAGVNLPTLTMTGGAFGTPQYMAPEQWHDAKGVDTRADIYSFGCILYEMLTGRHVNSHLVGRDTFSAGGWYRFHQGGQVQGLEDFAASVSEVVQGCLAKELERRPASFEEVARAVGEVCKAVTRKGLLQDSSERVTVDGLVSRASSFEQLGMHEEAVETCDEVLSLDGGNTDAWCNKGVALGRMKGQEREAICCLDQCLARDPAKAEALLSKAHLLLVLGKHQEARACFLKARWDPRADPSVQGLLGRSVTEAPLRSEDPFKFLELPRRAKVLVTDANDRRCELLAGILEPLVASVKWTVDPREAITLVRTFAPDLLVTDLWKPEKEMDGYGMIRLIRKENVRLPILVWSHADLEESARIRVLEIGGDAVLDRLSDVSSIRATVLALLCVRRKPVSSFPPPTKPFTLSITSPPLQLVFPHGRAFLVPRRVDPNPWIHWLSVLGISSGSLRTFYSASEIASQDASGLALLVVEVDHLRERTFEVMRRFRNTSPTVRIIAAGGRARRTESLAAGADAYIEEPVTREKFVDTVLSLFPPPTQLEASEGTSESKGEER